MCNQHFRCAHVDGKYWQETRTHRARIRKDSIVDSLVNEDKSSSIQVTDLNHYLTLTLKQMKYKIKQWTNYRENNHLMVSRFV
jgi:hypothetical protein